MPSTNAPIRFGAPFVVEPKHVVATNMSSTLSPDGDELSVLFDELLAESQSPQAARCAVSTVSLAIPLEPPPSALRVRVNLDLRGRLVKTAGAHAAILIALGDTLVTRNFELGTEVDRALDVSVRESMPAHPGGRLVERVLVSVWLSVARQSAQDSALLVVDSLDLSVQVR